MHRDGVVVNVDADSIKQHMQMNGLSAKDMSELLGIGYSSLYKIFYNGRTCGITYKKMNDLFGTKNGELLDKDYAVEVSTSEDCENGVRVYAPAPSFESDFSSAITIDKDEWLSEDDFLIPWKPDVNIVEHSDYIMIRFTEDLVKRFGSNTLRIATKGSRVYFLTNGEWLINIDTLSVKINGKKVPERIRPYVGEYVMQYDDEHDCFYVEMEDD